MSYELWFKVDGQHVSAQCVSPEQAAMLWDVLSGAKHCEIGQQRPLRAKPFNVESRAALHAVMDYAASINNAHTGSSTPSELRPMDCLGSIDAPEYFPTGSTESYQNWDKIIPIASTHSRRWLR